MSEKYSTQGRWWIAGEKDNSQHGLLTFTPDGGAVLDLNGRLAWALPESAQFILGITPQDEQITLPEAICTKLGANESVYRSSVALIGKHFASHNDLMFDEIAGEYDHFSAWFAAPEAKVVMIDGVPGVTYTHPTTTTLMDADGIRISLCHGYTEDVAWDRDCPFQLRLHNTVSLQRRGDLTTLMGLLGHFRNLVTLGLCQPVREHWIRVGQIAGDSKCDVQVLYEPVSTMPKDISYRHDRLFSYQDLGEDASKYLANWFDRRVDLDSLLTLYFNALYAPAPFVDVRLLNLIQALESYHRRVVGTTELPRVEHKRRVASVLATVSPDLRDWVKARLEYSNEVSLLARINWLLSEFGAVLKPILKDGDKIAKRLRDHRNYMTHFDVRLKEKKAVGAELIRLIELCKLLLELICMREMGLPAELISQIAPRSRSYRAFAYFSR